MGLTTVITSFPTPHHCILKVNISKVIGTSTDYISFFFRPNNFNSLSIKIAYIRYDQETIQLVEKSKTIKHAQFNH